MNRLFELLLLVIISTALSGCCKDDADCKPNLIIPAQVWVQNPYNGVINWYINEWYWCSRFTGPWWGVCGVDFYGNPIPCNGLYGQNGWFYYGQNIPSFQPGDSILVYKHIFNIRTGPNTTSFNDEQTSHPHTTRVIVRDLNGNLPDRKQDVKLPEIPPGGSAIFQSYIKIDSIGNYTYEVITDFFDDNDESNESDNVGDIPGLSFSP